MFFYNLNMGNHRGIAPTFPNPRPSNQKHKTISKNKADKL